MKSKIFILSCVLCALITSVNAQVKIGNNPNTIDANSLLELESTNKGFLPPRVVINNLNTVAPLTGTVPAGMLVFSSGGSVADGYYYWNGSQWIPFIDLGETSIVSKSASVTLTKTETFVIASGDITLTLPAITAADDGLSMTVKNVGTHTDQVDVVPSGSSTIDGADISKHFRWVGKTYVASGGDWLIKGHNSTADNVFEVSPTGSWTTLDEILEFLGLHMAAPSVVKLVSGDYPVTTTLNINLGHPLTIQGSSYGAATVSADPGLSGAMFVCESETYFKMLAFDGTGYGTAGAGEDAIHLQTDYEYYEIKDCTFDAFNKAIVATTNIELWVFEVDITNSVAVGIELATGANAGVSLKISETDFIGCEKGINFLSGVNAIVSVLNCGFYNGDGTDIGVNYVPASFTSVSNMFITNNTWNNTGAFFSGFDFSLSTGRDANIFIRNNSGSPDRNAHCRVNVTNNTTLTGITQDTWIKATWDAGKQSSTTTKWTVGTNRITYQPVNKSDGWSMITGNITATSGSETVVISIVKNGNSAVRFGETELRIVTSGQPYQFATSIYFSNTSPTDYYEIWVYNDTSGADITFNDIQWFTETK